jgi:hypothetical protein
MYVCLCVYVCVCVCVPTGLRQGPALPQVGVICHVIELDKRRLFIYNPRPLFSYMAYGIR